MGSAQNAADKGNHLSRKDGEDTFLAEACCFMLQVAMPFLVLLLFQISWEMGSSLEATLVLVCE